MWHKIWSNKGIDLTAHDILEGHTASEIFLTLKGLAGFDSTGQQLTYDAFHKQHTQIRNELSFSNLQPRKLESVFEVGCGGGAELYLFQNDGVRTGGIDYSDHLISIAKGILNNYGELICGEATDTPTDVKYDAVLSYGVFMYFSSYEYAEKVLELMYTKSIYSIGLIDILDLSKKDAFVEYRSRLVENYAEKYKGLDKLFFSKEFFLKFADKHGLNIRFSYLPMPNYWNNDFVFNVFMTKE